MCVPVNKPKKKSKKIRDSFNKTGRKWIKSYSPAPLKITKGMELQRGLISPSPAMTSRAASRMCTRAVNTRAKEHSHSTQSLSYLPHRLTIYSPSLLLSFLSLSPPSLPCCSSCLSRADINRLVHLICTNSPHGEKNKGDGKSYPVLLTAMMNSVFP